MAQSRRDTLLTLADTLAAEFAATAEQHDRDASFPFETIERLKTERVFQLLTPEDIGGHGANLEDAALFIRRLAQGDGVTALILTQHLSITGTFVRLAALGHERLGRFLQENPGAFVAIYSGVPEYEDRTPTLARKVEGGLVVVGRKGFGTGILAADFGVSSATVRGDGEPQTAFVLYSVKDTAIQIIEEWDTFGMRASASYDFVFNDLFVPDENVLAFAHDSVARPQPGSNNLHTTLVCFGNALFASLYLGIAESALRYTTDLFATRSSFGRNVPMNTSPAGQNTLGELHLQLREIDAIHRWSLHNQADPLAWNAETLPELVSMKDSVTHKSVALVDACLNAAGGMAYWKKSPLERLYRDVRAGPIHPFNHAMVVSLLGDLAAKGR